MSGEGSIPASIEGIETQITTRPSSHAKLLGDLAGLAGVDAESVVTYVYRIDDSGKKVPSGAGPQKYLARLDGPPDFEDIRARWGGGFYEVLVQKRNGTMVTTATFGIEGPPKLIASEAPSAPSVTSAPVSDVDRMAGAVAAAITPALEQMAQAVKAIAESHASAPAVEPMNQLAMMREMFAMVRDVAPAPSVGDASSTLETFLRGVKLGRDSEQGGPSVGEALLQIAPKALETLGTIGNAMATRPVVRPRAAAPGVARPGAQPVAPASAQLASSAVVETEVAPASAAGGVVARVRWLVEHLDAMCQAGADPEKIADAVEDLLTVFEIQKLVGYVREVDGEPAVDTATALAELGQLHPVPAGLASESGQLWLAAFLARLAEPADDDEPTSDAPSS